MFLLTLTGAGITKRYKSKSGVHQFSHILSDEGFTIDASCHALIYSHQDEPLKLFSVGTIIINDNSIMLGGKVSCCKVSITVRIHTLVV